MLVRVTNVVIPAMSTIGCGHGVEVDSGLAVYWAADLRPMQILGEALMVGGDHGEDIIADLFSDSVPVGDTEVSR